MAIVRLPIGPADDGCRMTWDEFREAEEQPGFRYELAQGVLEVTEVFGDAHGQTGYNLHEAFGTYLRQNPGVLLRIGHGSEIRYIIPELETDQHPDLALVFRGAPRYARGRRRADLAVEVVSPGVRARRRDYEAKRAEYLACGVREYWIVDPDLRHVTVLARRDDPAGLTWTESVFRGPDLIVSPLLPGFAGTVAELWTDVEFEDQTGP